MKVYEVKRNGITILLPNDQLPKEGDIVVREWDVEMPEPGDEVPTGDYMLHYEGGEWTIKEID